MARRKKGKGKAAKKARAAQFGIEEEYKKQPHTFIFNRGKVGKNVRDLVLDLRRAMKPYTAESLRAGKKNVLKDFVSVAGLLNVTHFIMLSKTEISTSLRIARLPRGPTLSFKVQSYSLARDVISSLKRHAMEQKQFSHHPLLVMNGFSGDKHHLKLMTTMFQNMFPSININKLKLNQVRRCVLLSYDSEKETVDFRHYNIKAVPVGMSRTVKKLVKAQIPNLARFDDVSEYLLKGGADLSESEAEMDGDHNTVTLPQSLSSRGNIKSAQSAIRLTEIGPRLTLQLMKIEEGFCEGEIMYHSLIEKTDDEIQQTKVNREKKRLLKAQRRQKQEENVAKKKKEKETLKEKCLSGMKTEDAEATDDSEKSDDNGEQDLNYYREEVGEEPDTDLFPKVQKNELTKGRKRKIASKPEFAAKKQKQEDGKNSAVNEKLAAKKKRMMDFNKMIQRRKEKKLKKDKKRTGKSKGGVKVKQKSRQNLGKKQKK